MKRAIVVALLIAAGVLLGGVWYFATWDARCFARLEERGRSAGAPGEFDWQEAAPAAHLHLTRRDLAWDMATDVLHEARRTRICPDPIPPAANVLASAAAWDAHGLDALLRTERPGVRIAPDVPYHRVQWLFDEMRASGMTQIDLRRTRCIRPTNCVAQELRVGLLDWPEEGWRPPRDRIRERLDESRGLQRHVGEPSIDEPSIDGFPSPQGLQLRLVETETGWQVSGSGGLLAPGCALVQELDGDENTVAHEEGFETVVECVKKVKREFPDEVLLSFGPSPNRAWTTVARHLQSLRFDGNHELFPEVLLPPAP